MFLVLQRWVVQGLTLGGVKGQGDPYADAPRRFTTGRNSHCPGDDSIVVVGASGPCGASAQTDRVGAHRSGAPGGQDPAEQCFAYAKQAGIKENEIDYSILGAGQTPPKLVAALEAGNPPDITQLGNLAALYRSRGISWR